MNKFYFLYIYDRDQWRGVQKLEFIEMSLSLKREKSKNSTCCEYHASRILFGTQNELVRSLPVSCENHQTLVDLVDLVTETC